MLVQRLTVDVLGQHVAVIIRASGLHTVKLCLPQAVLYPQVSSGQVPNPAKAPPAAYPDRSRGISPHV